jgi:hypothetical protein
MLCSKTRISFALALVALVAGSQGIAQTVPDEASGMGYYRLLTLLGGIYGGGGTGTHLGAQTFLGNVTLTPIVVDPTTDPPTVNPLKFDFSILPTDPQETVAANGGKIYFSGAGEVDLIPQHETFTVFSAVWLGHFKVEGGTGRFVNAGPGPQPLDVIAINDPFTFADPVWSFDWELKGKLRLR